MLWSIPKTGVDFQQSRPAVITKSQATSQALTSSAVDIYSIQEKSHGSDKVQSNPGADQGALRQTDAADQAARRSAAIRIWLRAYQVHALVQRFRSSNHIGP